MSCLGGRIGPLAGLRDCKQLVDCERSVFLHWLSHAFEHWHMMHIIELSLTSSGQNVSLTCQSARAMRDEQILLESWELLLPWDLRRNSHDFSLFCYSSSFVWKWMIQLFQPHRLQCSSRESLFEYMAFIAHCDAWAVIVMVDILESCPSTKIQQLIFNCKARSSSNAKASFVNADSIPVIKFLHQPKSFAIHHDCYPFVLRFLHQYGWLYFIHHESISRLQRNANKNYGMLLRFAFQPWQEVCILCASDGRSDSLSTARQPWRRQWIKQLQLMVFSSRVSSLSTRLHWICQASGSVESSTQETQAEQTMRKRTDSVGSLSSMLRFFHSNRILLDFFTLSLRHLGWCGERCIQSWR